MTVLAYNAQANSGQQNLPETNAKRKQSTDYRGNNGSIPPNDSTSTSFEGLTQSCPFVLMCDCKLNPTPNDIHDTITNSAGRL